MSNINNVETIVAAALDGASEIFLEDVAAHGIHNITNDYNGESDEEYEAFAAEFKRQANAALRAIEAAQRQSDRD